VKYLAIAFLILGIVCITFGCHHSDIPSGAPNTDTEGARSLADIEHFCSATLLGLVAIVFGLYFADRARAGRAVIHGSAALALTRPRFCPKCGKPLRMSECKRGKQFGFIPRRLCPECGSFVEQSGARIFGLGFVLLFWAIFGGFRWEGAPDFVLATACIAGPIGFILFVAGAGIVDRQFRLVKRYESGTPNTKR
jgi:hypothetical protein